MNSGTTFRIWLRPAQYLPGDRGDLTVAHEQEAQQVPDRVALGPGEVDVRNQAGAVPDRQRHLGHRVGDHGTAHGQDPVAEAFLADHVQLGLEVRGIAHRDLDKDQGRPLRYVVDLPDLDRLLPVLRTVTGIGLVGYQVQRPALGCRLEVVVRRRIEGDAGSAQFEGAPGAGDDRHDDDGQ